MREQVAERIEVVVARGLVRVDPEDREDLAVPVRELERGAAALDRRTDGEDSPNVGLARATNELVRWVCARVEVRMGVDHAACAAASRRAISSATTVSGSSFVKSCSGSRSFWPGGRSLGSQRPIHVS